MKIAFGSDHAGLEGRRAAIAAAQAQCADAEILDWGPDSTDSVDYPDFAHRIAAAVAAGEIDFGVLVCGTGQGMAMAANRHACARAAVLTDEFTTRMARGHNNANIACFGERVIGASAIGELTALFLSTPFEGDRHARRVGKIEP